MRRFQQARGREAKKKNHPFSKTPISGLSWPLNTLVSKMGPVVRKYNGLDYEYRYKNGNMATQMQKVVSHHRMYDTTVYFTDGFSFGCGYEMSRRIGALRTSVALVICNLQWGC